MMLLRTAAVTVSVLTALAAGGARAEQDSPRKVNVEAERFSFSPSRIKLAVGEEVEIHLRSADTAHGFKVDNTDIDVEIPKRGKGEAVVRFTGTSEGRFKFECNRMCGAGHHFMRGEIVVEAKGK
jgi:cytochrome c oxidase subunit 2